MAAAAGPNVVEDGLVLALDAGNTKSYSSIPAITYVGGTSDSDNSSSFTLSGLQSGDLVLYFSAEDGTGSNVNTPTGASWTAIPGLTTQPDNDNNPDSAAFYVFATGTSVTASGLNTGNRNVRVMIAFRNVNSTNPFDVNATENSAGGLPDPPSITPVTDNSMIVAVGLLDDHDIANSISPPTGYTTAVNMDSQGGANDSGVSGATIMTAYKLLATAAAEDPSGFTGTTGDPQKGITIALRPETNTTWTDLSGKGNNGTLTDGPTYSSGDGGSIVFDGTNDLISGISLPSISKVTVEWWGTSDYPSSSTYLVPVISTASGNWTDGFGFYQYNGNVIWFVNHFNSNITIVQSAATSFGFTHWVGTYDLSNIKLYRNGSLIGTTAYTTAINQSTTNLDIASQSTSYHWDGKISNVKVYNKALTASEVEQNFNATKGRYGL